MGNSIERVSEYIYIYTLYNPLFFKYNVSGLLDKKFEKLKAATFPAHRPAGRMCSVLKPWYLVSFRRSVDVLACHWMAH